MIWDLNLSASFSRQDVHISKKRERYRETRERDREEREIEDLEDLNTFPCRVRVVVNL